MTTRWNDIFQLPRAALAGDKRIPKTMLVQQAALTKHEQKTLDKAKRIEHFATVQKSTTRMLPYIDDERDIQGIIFLHCELASGTQAVAEVAHLLHKCFPNPTIIMMEAGDKICISVALTRKSHAERGATVVDQVESTGVFDSCDNVYCDFLDALGFNALPQDGLWSYLQTIAWNIMLSRVIKQLGFFPSCERGKRDALYALIEHFDSLNAEVKQLQNDRKSAEISLNESAKLRIKVKKSERELNGIVAEIKELCND